MVITIDGPAGAGKSTAAQLLSRRLGLAYLDTGATYRALAWAAKKERLHPIADAEKIARLALQLPLALSLSAAGALQVRLAGSDISKEIRTEEVSEAAALISQHPSVRSALVKRQRELASLESESHTGSASARESHGRTSRFFGVVAEGRDTGSVVFPRAQLKFFLSAEETVRARRRQRELERLYGSRTPLAQIREQLEFRDGLDRTRRVGPLIKPKGAVTIDTTHRSVAQVVRVMLRHVERAVRSS